MEDSRDKHVIMKKGLRLRLTLSGIYLNRIAEKVNGYLSSCVPVGRGWEGEKPGYFKLKKNQESYLF